MDVRFKTVPAALIAGAAFSVTIGWAMAQPPLVKTYAYSRATLPGIREEIVKNGGTGASRPSPFPLKYLLYVEVPKGSAVSVEGVWLQGTHYRATLNKVPTPVVVASDPVVATGGKDTLVNKTTNDVYAVLVGGEKPTETSSPGEQPLVAKNEAVIVLTVNTSRHYGTVRTIKTLKPAAAP